MRVVWKTLKWTLIGLGGLFSLFITIGLMGGFDKPAAVQVAAGPSVPPVAEAAAPAVAAPVAPAKAVQVVPPVQAAIVRVAARAAPEPAQPAAPAVQQRPAAEVALLAAVDQAMATYAAGANDMAKGAARPARAKAICAALRGLVVRDWLGEVETLSSNSDGKGVLAVRLARKVTAGTWNNSFSDSDEHTLLDPAGATFAAAAGLKVGGRVRFSGTFFRSETDCVHEKSITMAGSMEEPEFVFRFTAIAAD